MVAVAEGGSGARYAAAVCVMYWLLLSYPLTLALASIATLTLTLLLYLKTLLRCRDSLARLTCRDSPLAHYVTLHCHAFRRALQLPLWCRNRHVQSFLAHLAWEPGVQFERQYLQLSDKGLAALDWELGGQHLPHGHPVLLVLPDLPQSALHVGALCRQAFDFGFKAVVVNRRGQGNSALHTARLPAYGDTGDLRQVVDFLRQEGLTLSAVGIGTGGDLLLSYLGQYGSSAYLKSAVCVSPSYVARHSLHAMAFPYSCLYLSHLKQAVLRHANIFGEVASLARGAWSLREFDRRLHCRRGDGGGGKGRDVSAAGGEQGESESMESSGGQQEEVENCTYSSLEEFWVDNEPMREADEIAVPVLCVSSLDDPVCRAADIQHDLFRSLPNLFLLTLPQGGHAGFRAELRGLSWADNAAMDFVLAMLHFHGRHPQLDAYTQTELDYFDLQCQTDDDYFEVVDDHRRQDEQEDDTEEDDKPLLTEEDDDDDDHDFHHLPFPTTKDSCPNGHCWRVDEEYRCDEGEQSGRTDREEQEGVVAGRGGVGEVDRLLRTPTETHGLR